MYIKHIYLSYILPTWYLGFRLAQTTAISEHLKKDEAPDPSMSPISS